MLTHGAFAACNRAEALDAASLHHAKPSNLRDLALLTICTQINVEFTQGSPFSFDLCPDHCIEAGSSQQELPAAPAQLQEQPTDNEATNAATDPGEPDQGGVNVHVVQDTSPASGQAAAGTADGKALPVKLEETAAAAAAAGPGGQDDDAAGDGGEHARQDRKKKPPLEVMAAQTLCSA